MSRVVTRMVSWLALLYVALLPVGRSGLPMNAQWGDLLLPVLAFITLGGEGRRWWRGREDWPLALYLTITLATAAISADPLLGVEHLGKQVSVALILIVFRLVAAREPSLTRALQRTYAGALALVAAVSIFVVFLPHPSGVPPATLGAFHNLPFLGPVGRLRGALLTPEMMGNALLVAFVLASGLRASASGSARFAWTALAALLAVGEFLTFSHSVAGFAVAAVVFMASSIPSRPLRSLAWSGAISVVLMVNAASILEPGPVVNDYGVGPVSFEIMGERVEGSLNHYAALKQVAWSVFLDHPLTGVGPGRFPTETERAFQEGRFNARYRYKPAQSDLPGRLAETGILGGLSLLALWAAWIRRGLSLKEEAVMGRAAFAAVCGLLVNSVNADVMNFRFLWLAVAWLSTPMEDEASGSR